MLSKTMIRQIADAVRKGQNKEEIIKNLAQIIDNWNDDETYNVERFVTAAKSNPETICIQCAHAPIGWGGCSCKK